MIGTATISDSGVYRYTLDRVWRPSGRRAAMVLLNPSTADASRDDPTCRRCIGLMRARGFGSLTIVNLFAFRATDPDSLRIATDPIGRDNDDAILHACKGADLVVAAWGMHGSLGSRGDRVRAMIMRFTPRCFGLTKSGEPRHPLYLPSSARLRPLGIPRQG